jgi:L-asparaginase
MVAKANVLIIYTGGTIGAVPSVKGNYQSPLKPAGEEDFKSEIPGLGEEQGITWDIKGLTDQDGKSIEPLDSSNVNSEHWIYMASMIEQNYNKYDGFVVLHGTDTMTFTASALSFMLENLAKPVIITGSQLPIFKERTDAKQNLINALYIAGYKATGLPLVPEVVICFADRLLRGNRTRKVSSTSWAGFDTPNYPHLGSIGEHIVIKPEMLRSPADNNRNPFRAYKQMVSDVMDIAVFPGLKPKQLESILSSDKIKGIVLRTFGAGNAPDNEEFLQTIENATKKGKCTILNVTQCNQGMVEMGLYAASSGLLERGVISGLDMTPEAALTKMMFILGSQRGEDIQLELQQNLRGEQSENLFELRYKISENEKVLNTEHLELSERPPGSFQKDELRCAILRVSGVNVENKKEGDPVCINAFIGLPEKNNYDKRALEYAGELTTNYAGEKDTVLLLDITEALKRVYTKDGSPIYVGLKSEEKFKFRGLFVTLFARAT